METTIDAPVRALTAVGGIKRFPLRGLLLTVLLVGLTFGIYLPTLDDGLSVYDDAPYVMDARREVVRNLSWDSIAWALSSFHQGFYAPVTWISYMVDASLAGGGSGGFHRTNVLLHAANGVLVFLVLFRMTGALWRSGLVSLLFVVHPLHVESVAWVTGRKDVISMFFLLCALHAYVWYQSRPRTARYALVLVAYSLSLMAKPMVITFPLLLLVLDFWPLGAGRPWRSGGMIAAAGRPPLSLHGFIANKIPLLVLSGLFASLTYQAHTRIYLPPVTMELLFERVPAAAMHYFFYLGKLVWPGVLSMFYTLIDGRHTGTIALVAALALGAITAGAIRLTKSRPYLLAGWTWYLIALVPVLQLVKTAEHPVADRFAYLPAIGIYVAISWAVADLQVRRGAARGALAGIVVGLIAVLSLRSGAQVALWGDQVALFRLAVRMAPENVRARMLLGDALAEGGRGEEALEQYRLVASRMPGRSEPHRQMGNLLFREGLLQEALHSFQEAVSAEPRIVDNRVNLGIVLLDLGRVTEAVPHLEEAVRLEPSHVRALTNLGIAFGEQGDVEKARARLMDALNQNTDSVLALQNLGVLSAREGHYRDAAERFRAVVRLAPSQAEPHYLLGRVLELQGLRKEAREEYLAALRIEPTHGKAAESLREIRVE